ncbi:MAG: carboxypeptidase-like regulatory domain-containing protein, partial [Bacteroides sp.]|nr:carboxypeptidase-like regulatory domain-containing protein [Bacteroides sp.]
MKIPFFIILSLLVVNTWAQEIILSGKVTDTESGLPLEFSTIALTEVSSGLLISGAVCDAEGRFRITGELIGEYEISFSFVGFTPHSQGILIGELNKIFDLGVIELFPLSEHLEEVT